MPYFDDSEDRNDIKAAFCAEVGAQLFDGHNALRRDTYLCTLAAAPQSRDAPFPRRRHNCGQVSGPNLGPFDGVACILAEEEAFVRRGGAERTSVVRK